MEELRQLVLVVIVVLILSFIGFNLFNLIPLSGEVVADYNAILYPDGRLVEVFVYHIGEGHKYSMLYRYWEAPLTLDYLNEPHVKLLSINCPGNAIPYVKDYRGHVTLWKGSPIYVNDISVKAYRNEAGCYFPSKIPAGDYRVVFEYQLYPPLQCDNSYCHLNLMLARDHITYSHVNVTLLDPGNDVKVFYVHVPDYNVEKSNGKISVTGVSPEDQLLEIEFAYNRHGSINIQGFISTVNNAVDETVRANKGYLLSYNIVKYSAYTILGVLVAYPAILLAIYYWKGREKKYVVPKYLSYIPDPKKKPWQVNLLFKGDALTIDADALYATILDLERKGYLEITGDREHVIIKIKKKPGEGELDRYEQDVFEFIRYWSSNGVLDIEELKERVKSMPDSHKKSIYEWMKSLIQTPSWMKELAKNYVTSIRGWFAILSAVFIIVAIVIAVAISDPRYMPYNQRLAVMFFMLGLQNIVATIPPSQLFGRWRKDYYKEKLQWDAFKNMLKDFAMIQKYAPQDLVIWKEWLVYGTALGVGKKVVEAMEKLKIPIPAAGYFVYVWPRHYYAVMRTVNPKASGSGVGGGFGAGGGFGGGGGGVR